MVEIVVSVTAKVSEYLVDPVVRQLGYLFLYRTNIDDLFQQVEKLRDARARSQHSVDEAIRNGHKIEDGVRKWFTRADEFIQKACDFLEDEKKAQKSCLNGLCPNLKSSYQLSRAAKKKSGIAAQIHRDGQFQTVSYRPPLQEVRSAPPEVLQSRISILNEVMEALRDVTINRIGVWGLGGVGKTTLVNQVAEQAEQENLFHKVVMAPVSQNPDYKEIQQQFADLLGMKFEEGSQQGRANRLYQRMKDEKTILIILDDLWGEVELKKIGIPSPDDHKGCKLLLTSRNKDVLVNQMSIQKDFGVEHLKEDEAWILFKNIAGDSIKNPGLESVAMDIAKECAGLPLAIVTVATALKNKSLSIWKDALQQLRTQTSTNITGMEKKVYSSLKLSYDYLEGDEVKSLFLLGGLIPWFHAEDLLKYGMGLRLFNGTNTLEEARNRVDTLVDKLKASNLLLYNEDIATVRMHDVVRNVALEIALKEHHDSTFQNAEWPKMDDFHKFTMRNVDVSELPDGLLCPKLELFGCYLNTNATVEIPNTFFEGMRQLKVLDFTNMHLPALPSSLLCLANLRTLCLDACKLGDIVIISELKQLEILSLIDSNIERLPRELTQLTRLRLLDLKGSSKLKVIPPAVIPSLAQLENLCMENSFTQWEMEGKTNACLAELKHLSNLTSLDIQIPDAKLLPKDIVFVNLERYRIFVGDVWTWGETSETKKTNRTLKLNKFHTSFHLVDDIVKLLKRTEDLHLRELHGATDVLSKLDREGFLKLKHLIVESSPEIQYIMNSMELIPSYSAFLVLEKLFLSQLINLKEICHGQFPAGSFGCLRKIKVEDCGSLKFLFSLPMARSLSLLEKIKVTGCKSMDKVVAQGSEEIEDDGDGAASVSFFPKLLYLTLRDLPKLVNFCFDGNSNPGIMDCQLLPSLGNLRSLKLKNCLSQLILFPARLLQNLNVLIVENFDQLEQVFDRPVALLPKLEKLSLIGLPKLRHVWNWGSSTNHLPCTTASAPPVTAIMLPKLICLNLDSLPALTSFCPGYPSLQKLNHADLDTPPAVLFDERVAFPSLEFLDISRLDHVKKIWHNQLPDDSFSKLKDVRVDSCRELLNIFPSCVLKKLESLQILVAQDCSSLEEVFDMEGIDVDLSVKEGVTVTKLSQLFLQLLPKVEQIWSKELNQILSFRSLKSIVITECQNLKSLFPASLVRDLPQLEVLQVFTCGIEEIVAKDDKIKTLPVFVFPKVTSLYLSHLHHLKSFYPGVHTSQWPLLKELTVHECQRVNLFASKAPTFHQTQQERSPNRPILQPLFLVQQVAFPCLEELTLDSNDDTELWPEQVPLDSFPRLRHLNVCGYWYISVVIPSFMCQRLHNLESLNVGRCRSVKEIFQLEGLDEKNQALRLGRLREICLNDLPELTHLLKERSKPGLELKSLEKLKVWDCESLINLVPCSISFQNLCTLDVWSCGSLRSLISPTVAKTLVKLKTLAIGGSHMMEEVVEKKEGEAEDEIAFPKLQQMALLCLPNLNSFSSGGYVFSFPSLEHMVVEECPIMKIFSSGGVTTPKLERIEVSNDEWHWQDDLNTTIHKLFHYTKSEQ